MLKRTNRFDEYAYRIANRKPAASLTALEEGQWVTLDDNGDVVVSDGTKKSFISIVDINKVKASGKVTYLHGTFELTVDQFDVAGTYGAMTPLKVNGTGILAPWDSVADADILVVAYSVGAPVNGELNIVSA